MSAHTMWVGVSLWASVAMLSAQSQSGSFELSPVAGYLFGGTVSERISEPAGPVLRDTLEDDVTYGLRLGYAFPNGLEPELEWSRVERDLQVSTIPPGALSTRTDFFLGGLAYNFSSSRLRPYVGLAAGVALLSSDVTDSQARFTGKLSLGLKAFVTPWLALRLEAAGYATRLGDAPYGLTCTTFGSGPEGPVVPVSCVKPWLFDGSLGGGLVFAF